ncbi:MAG: DUF58 domain-containing protein [Streptosporangiaceae bacterium]
MRLTGLGAATAVVSACGLTAGYVLGYSGLALLGAGGLILLGVAALGAVRRPPVDISREIFPLRVARGEPAVGMLTAANRSGWSGLRLEVRETFGTRDLPVTLTYLRRRAVREVGYQLPTGHRGLFDVGPLRWARADTFGMVRREQSLAGVQQLWVHPVVRHLELGPARRAQRWDDARSDAAPEGSITFHTLRAYVAGDDLRHIHWRSSARLNTLMVRRNIDVSLPMTTVLLVTDTAAYPDPEAFEDAVEVAAAAAVSAARQRLPVRLLTTHAVTVTGRGGHDDPRLFLDFLAAARLGEGGGLPTAADRLSQGSAGGALVIAAGVLDSAATDAARRLASRYDTAVLALFGTAASAGDKPAESGQGDGTDGASGSARGWHSGTGDVALTVIEAAGAAEFCARWNEMAR